MIPVAGAVTYYIMEKVKTQRAWRCVFGSGFFATELKFPKKMAGFVSLNYIDEHTRNLGYCIHTEYQGQGYASEVVMEIMKYAHKGLNVHKLISGTAVENIV